MVERFPAYAVTLIRVGIVVVVAFLLTWGLRFAVRRFERRLGWDEPDVTGELTEKRAQTLGHVLRAAATFGIWTIASLIALDQAGVSIAPLIAAAGIGGVALGFGAQSMVRDLINGFYILLEEQYHVGDVIRVAGVTGMVEKVTLRATVLRDIAGGRHVVPNGEVRVSTNFTKVFSRYTIDLPVPYDADIDRAVGVARSAAEELRSDPAFGADILGPLEVLGVDSYGESEILVKIYLDTRPGRHWTVGRELRKRIKSAYDRAGIPIPFPQREVLLREATKREEPDGGSG